MFCFVALVCEFVIYMFVVCVVETFGQPMSARVGCIPRPMGPISQVGLNPGLDRAKTWFGRTWSRPGLDQVLFWISQLLWTGFRPGFTKPGLSPV